MERRPEQPALDKKGVWPISIKRWKGVIERGGEDKSRSVKSKKGRKWWCENGVQTLKLGKTWRQIPPQDKVGGRQIALWQQ